MSAVDRIFELGRISPFDQLRHAERVLIAAAATERTYAPGEVIGRPGRPLRHLYVCVDGSLEADGTTLPSIFGTGSLLFGRPLERPVCAGGAGASCILIRRAHFHTIVNECPALIVGLLRDSAPGDLALV